MNESIINLTVAETERVGGLSASQILILPVFILIVTVSVIGNIFVITSWVSYPTIRNPAFIYGINKSWLFGKTMCFLWMSSTYIFWFVSSNHLVLIALDRYRILVEGLPYLQRRSISQALHPVLFIWFMGFCVVSPLYLDWDSTATYEFVTADSKWICETKKSTAWVLLTALAGIFGPLLALLSIYIKVYLELKKRFWNKNFHRGRQHPIEDCSKTSECGNDSELKTSTVSDAVQQRKVSIAVEKERKAGITLGFLILAFFICWAPVIVIDVMFVLRIHVPKVIFLLGVLLASFNAGVNPIIYAVRNQEFQRCFKSIIRAILKPIHFC